MESAFHLILCIRYAVVCYDMYVSIGPMSPSSKTASSRSFHKTLDGEMKRLRSIGYGVTSKQAAPLTIEDENRLWVQGLLEDHSPQALLDTMVFLCGMSFALQSGQEHRSLQLSQFELVEPNNNTAYLHGVP